MRCIRSHISFFRFWLTPTLNGFDGSLELLNRGQFNNALGERIPVSECSWEKAVFVDVRGGAESHEALMLTAMGCSGSLGDIIWYGYCDLFVDDLIKYCLVDFYLLMWGGIYLLS